MLFQICIQCLHFSCILMFIQQSLLFISTDIQCLIKSKSSVSPGNKTKYTLDYAALDGIHQELFGVDCHLLVANDKCYTERNGDASALQSPAKAHTCNKSPKNRKIAEIMQKLTYWGTQLCINCFFILIIFVLNFQN